ncbi:MAG: acetylglucosamine-6-sulfatase, partial [Verrucomicrobiales bacterium]|nr:acetylglucosamine-6-sulfatase [Verrucomicrobiales bacterium]
MKRLLSIPLCLVALLALGQAQAAKRPNILFMMSDDHAAEGIGAYGSWLKDYVHTPAIDRLAAEGMRFTNVCCNNSICSPSRASIISGQYSHVTGALNLGCELKPNAPS